MIAEVAILGDPCGLEELERVETAERKGKAERESLSWQNSLKENRLKKVAYDDGNETGWRQRSPYWGIPAASTGVKASWKEMKG